jgi:RimJ/RimL family protein N-acetyltransferase
MTTPTPGPRVALRQWVADDLDAFVEMNADPTVMATIGPVMDRSASVELFDRIRRRIDEDGLGLWCIDLGGEPIGWCGLSRPWFRDGTEIGWRLRSGFWGRGYATESAMSVLDWAFSVEGGDLAEVISFTASVNARSRAVMERIGLERDLTGDFEHPGVPPGDRLAPHVLYSLGRDRYRSRA